MGQRWENSLFNLSEVLVQVRAMGSLLLTNNNLIKMQFQECA